ncbi:aluminum-activated malate transporter 2-like [Cucurbita maxima]|uniref:Aluminum-activated malate transporter 2-like n=1 Tax=Cucurbita maxima TaxID=3661 RepID=A0A6J1KQZ3_CUCMA|nr:aluminum-activated malate transporter 2-like [Cucurbita maxima]
MVEGSKETLTNDHHGWLKAKAWKLHKKMVELLNNATKVGKDDPRRIVHSLKLGLAITTVSLFFYFEPLYDGLGASSIWAIITVVVVFEFSVGATLGKGMNRAIATLIAGAIGFGAHYITSFTGNIWHPILLGILIYTISATASYCRFFPKLKAKYDYGLLIFILTFNMVALSGFRDDEILKLAWHRLANILVGAFIAVAICIFVRPVWAGADLHQFVATNIENLGTFLEGFGIEYFGACQGEMVGGGNVMKYRSVLCSKQNEEALAYQATWEPPHGKFRLCHPWKQYQKIGTLSRDCAYCFEILNLYLNTDQIQLPLEIQRQYQEQCVQVCIESSKALKAMAKALRDIVPPALAKSHIEIAKKTAGELKLLLASSHFHGDMNMVSTTTLILLLIDSFSCVEKIVDSIHELVSLARLNTALQKSDVTPTEQKGSGDKASSQPHHIVTIAQSQFAE